MGGWGARDAWGGGGPEGLFVHDALSGSSTVDSTVESTAKSTVDCRQVDCRFDCRPVDSRTTTVCVCKGLMTRVRVAFGVSRVTKASHDSLPGPEDRQGQRKLPQLLTLGCLHSQTGLVQETEYLHRRRAARTGSSHTKQRTHIAGKKRCLVLGERFHYSFRFVGKRHCGKNSDAEDCTLLDTMNTTCHAACHKQSEFRKTHDAAQGVLPCS